jgi:hypothetical protein
MLFSSPKFSTWQRRSTCPTLAKDLVAIFEHDANPVLGATTSGPKAHHRTQQSRRFPGKLYALAYTDIHVCPCINGVNTYIRLYLLKPKKS